ncbi:MAG: hypothetical protein AAGA48_16545 [Myxococcota bacterium]
MFKKFVSVTLLAWLGSSSAWAQPYGAETSAPACRGGFATLAGAIAAAGPDGTVFVSGSLPFIAEPVTAAATRNVTINGVRNDADAVSCSNTVPSVLPEIRMVSQGIRALEVQPGPNDTVVTINRVIISHTADGLTVAGDGGTIHLGDNSTLILDEGTAIRNGRTDGNGGCIAAVRSSVFALPGTSIDQCYAQHDGGGVSFYQRNTQTQNGSAIAFLADNVAGDNGGGVYADRHSVRIFGAEQNTAETGGGGAAYFTATNVSGDVTFEVYPTPTCDLPGDTCVRGNHAGVDGGAIVVSGDDARLWTAGRFTENDADDHGGAIRATNRAVVHLCPGTRLIENLAEGDGGGVHADLQTDVNVLPSCSPSPVSRVIYSDGAKVGTVTLNFASPNVQGGTLFSGNRAGWDPSLGGPILVDATRQGGGVFLDRSRFDIAYTNGPTLQWVRFEDNLASQDGGGLAATNQSETSVVVGNFDQGRPIEFLRNDARNNLGGAIFATGAGTTVDLDTTDAEVDIRDNLAVEGAAIAIVDGADLQLQYTDIVDNVGSSGTGGLFVDTGATATLGDCPSASGDSPTTPFECALMEGNVAGSADGAAIDVVDGLLSATRVRVHRNQALSGGASIKVRHANGQVRLANVVAGDASLDALHAAAGSVECNHCTLYQSDVAVHVDAGATATVNRSVLAENSSDVDVAFLTFIAGSCNTTQAPVPSLVFGTIDAGYLVDDDGYPEVLTNVNYQCTTGLDDDVMGLARPDPTLTGIAPPVAPANTVVQYEKGAYELFHACGDGVFDPHEECEDGNVQNWDGCNSLCEIEPPCPCEQDVPPGWTAGSWAGSNLALLTCEDGTSALGPSVSATDLGVTMHLEASSSCVPERWCRVGTGPHRAVDPVEEQVCRRL